MTTTSPPRLSKAALLSLIFGVLGCIPLLGFVAIGLGIPGFIFAGRPGLRGRWMAAVGTGLGVFTLISWSIAGYWIWQEGRAVTAAFRAPGVATREYIEALAAGDEKTAREHAVVSDDELRKDEAILQAQGAFIDTGFNYTLFNEGGASHVTGFATFKNGSLWVKADLTDSGGKWRVESAEFTVKK